MADFPLFGGTKKVQFGYDLTTGLGTAITSSASVDTKGAFIELASAAENDRDSFCIDVVISKDGVASNVLIDIAIGEAGFEQVFIPNLYFFTINGVELEVFSFPISVPRGVRISARSQGSISSAVPKVFVCLQSGGFTQGSALSGIKSAGDDVATTSGVTITQGNQVYGAWVEMHANTTKEFKGFVVASHRNILASWSTGNVAWRVAIGSAGNEVVISDGNVTSNDSSEKGARFASAFNNVSIPIGSRVSISASASSSNGDFTNDYVLYGVY